MKKFTVVRSRSKQNLKAPFTLQKIYGTARIKVARVPKNVARISCLHVLYSAVPTTAKSNFGTAKSNLGTSCGLSFLVSKLETPAVRMRSISFKHGEEQYLKYLLIKRPPATCIPNIPRNARHIFTSDFRRMGRKRRYRFFLSSCSNSRLQCLCGSILLDCGAK